MADSSGSATRPEISVAVVNSHLSGGAATAARRLHTALGRLDGVRSRFWHLERDQTPDSTYQFLDVERPATWWNKLSTKSRKRRIAQDQRQIASRPPCLEIYSLAERRYPTPCDPELLECDVLNLNWIAGGALDFASFFESIPNEIPIVWTLHDMNPFTGGCHYSDGCEAFHQHCGRCPQLPNPAEHDLSRRTLETKFRALRDKNLHVVAPSRWTERVARQSRVLSAARSFQTIAHCLDLQQFRPLPKQQARRELGIADQAVVLAFGADYLTNARKGTRQLIQALELVRCDAPLTALVFGSGDIDIWPATVSEVLPLGYLSDPAAQRTVYSAADFFVLPSLEEVLGLTGVEAMACGTPVVGFDCGGIPDFVRHGETGLLAATGDVHGLAEQITRLANQRRQREAMSVKARRLIEEVYDAENQAAKYADLFRRVVNESHGRLSQVA